MMISPAGYVRIHENDSFEQLIKERELLIDSIKRLEEIVFKDINKESQEWGICPSPDVQYQCNLEYLAELCNFMSQKYNREVVWESDIEENEATESAIKIRKEGITKLNVDAIVNAANDGLWEGGGVCGAIFREAGSVELTKACKAIGGCKTGNAVITPGFKLPAKYIIHAVGPVWHGGNQNEPKLLYSAYKQSLILAKENDCHSIGFPLISAGIFGYPKEQAWRKAIQACKDFINDNSDYDIEIYFAVLDDEIKQIGEQVLEELS